MKMKSLALISTVAAASSVPLINGFEVTTPYGNFVGAWAVCEPGNGGEYTWTRNDNRIAGVTSNWYLLTNEDDGQFLKCGGGNGDMSPAVRIGNNNIGPTKAPAGFPTASPVAFQDVSIVLPWGRATGKWAICNVSDPSKHEPSSFIWSREGVQINGESNIGYRITNDDVGFNIQCSITTAGGDTITSQSVFIGEIFETERPTTSPTVSRTTTPTSSVQAPTPTPSKSAPVIVPTAAPITPAPIYSPRNNGKLDILDFTPHLAGDEPFSVLPDSTVHARVDLVAPYTNGIRTFACYNGAETIRYAKSLGMTTVAGAWMDSRRGASIGELNCLIALAKEGVVDLAVVGSEVVTWNGLVASEIIAYIEQFRSQVPDVPVTTAIKYEAQILPENLAIVDAVDIVYVNIYPFWSGHSINTATSTFIQEYDDIVALANDKPVWVSETGWPSDGTCANGAAVPNAANQERYLWEILEWSRTESVVVSWFDSFEQLYKDGTEWCGVASHWGLFDAYGSIKPGPGRVLSPF